MAGQHLVNCLCAGDNEAMESRFNRYSNYLKARYGEPVYRVGIDAGFGCPNRNTDGSGGCFYCDEAGARAAYQDYEGQPFAVRSGRGPDAADPYWRALVENQIREGMAFLKRRYGARSFILYLQAFSGTFAPPDRLKEVYDFVLSFAPFREFVIGTRPDCFGDAAGQLLASYNEKGTEVWMEFGLQSYHDETLGRIGRGHDTASFERAFTMAREKGLKCAVHLIFGLPGEDDDAIEESVRRLARLRPDGIKIHNLHIAEGTRFARLWRQGELQPPGTNVHLRRVVSALELLPESTVIQRVTCDTSAGRLLAPLDFAAKNEFYRLLDEELLRRNTRQGARFSG